MNDINDEIYPDESESEGLSQVNEPEVDYCSIKEDSFEKDWQRGMSIRDFKEHLMVKLKEAYEC